MEEPSKGIESLFLIATEPNRSVVSQKSCRTSSFPEWLRSITILSRLPLSCNLVTGTNWRARPIQCYLLDINFDSPLQSSRISVGRCKINWDGSSRRLHHPMFVWEGIDIILMVMLMGDNSLVFSLSGQSLQGIWLSFQHLQVHLLDNEWKLDGAPIYFHFLTQFPERHPSWLSGL